MRPAQKSDEMAISVMIGPPNKPGKNDDPAGQRVDRDQGMLLPSGLTIWFPKSMGVTSSRRPYRAAAFPAAAED
jgi:hypothetical protein